MTKEYILGIRPSSEKGLHLGHFLGIIKPAMEFQNNLTVLIADLYDVSIYNDILVEQIQKYLPKAKIILQSNHKSKLFELKFSLEKIITVGKLSHMTQYKSKDDPYTSHLTYPLLMCADLMLFCQNKHVIVGEDQIQHIEYANDFIKKYNATYGMVYQKTQLFCQKDRKIMDLHLPEKKMSKSNHDKGTLYVSESIDCITHKIQKATSTEAGIENLKNIYQFLENKECIHSNTSDLKTQITKSLIESVCTKSKS